MEYTITYKDHQYTISQPAESSSDTGMSNS